MIKTKITESFGIKYPIFSAPMGPFYTTELSIAVSEAGGTWSCKSRNFTRKKFYKRYDEAVRLCN